MAKSLVRRRLADELAERIAQRIRSGEFCPGDRLPAINRMAKQYGVGHPTLREALKKLESIGVLDIRHGSGVYVGRNPDMLLVTNPMYGGGATRKVMLDLVSARLTIEVVTATLAAEHATDAHLRTMEELLDEAECKRDDDALLNHINMAFHREIARASGNTVFAQLLEVLTTLFQEEQLMLLDVQGAREQDHAEHRGILEAVRRRSAIDARERMTNHLTRLHDMLIDWDPDAASETSAHAIAGEPRHPI